MKRVRKPILVPPKRRKLKVVNRAYTTDEPCVGAKKKPLIRMPLFFAFLGEDGTMERVGPSIILIKPRVPRAQEKFVFVGGEKLREKRKNHFELM